MKDRGYINTKQNNVHYRGRVWVTPGDRKGKNICLDFGREELRFIAYVPEVTDEEVEKQIRAFGYDPKDWM